MKYLIPLLFMICIFDEAHAQKGTHTFFGEGFGPGGVYSINYDKILFSTEKALYSIRIGTSGYYREVDTNKKALSIGFPLMFNRLKPQKNINHNFEIGAGIGTRWAHYGDELTKTVKRRLFFGLFGFIGYRYQKPTGGLMLRAGWNPVYSIFDDWFLWYWPAFGIGYSF